MAAQESGIELDEGSREEDIFELQHHHLLRCLEKTTVKEKRGRTFVAHFDLARFDIVTVTCNLRSIVLLGCAIFFSIINFVFFIIYFVLYHFFVVFDHLIKISAHFNETIDNFENVEVIEIFATLKVHYFI